MTDQDRIKLAFISGAQGGREVLARFVEQGGDPIIAASIRANWAPSWGEDPGRPEVVAAGPPLREPA